MDGKLRNMFVATMAADTLPVVSAGRQAITTLWSQSCRRDRSSRLVDRPLAAVHALLHRAFLGRLQVRFSVRHISIQQYNPRFNIAVQPSVVSARGVIYRRSDRV